MKAFTRSKHRAMACETYYAGKYLSGLRGTDLKPETPSSEFHRYRSDYTRHLLFSGQEQDRSWLAEYLRNSSFSPETQALIAPDAETYKLPADITAVELLLSVDESYQPLDYIPFTDSYLMAAENAYLAGVLDYVTQTGAIAEITDVRTGYGEGSPFEPLLSATLLFCHAPDVEEIRCQKQFIRNKAQTPFQFFRQELPVMQQMIDAQVELAADLERRWRFKQRLEINPVSGLCASCLLECPARTGFSTELQRLQPLRSDEEAQALALRIYAADAYAAVAKKLLKGWIQERGAVPLGSGLSAYIKPGVQLSYPLHRTLTALGVPVPEEIRDYDLDLDSVTISGLTQKAGAKKRAGLLPIIDAVAKRKPTFDLTFGKKEEA